MALAHEVRMYESHPVLTRVLSGLDPLRAELVLEREMARRRSEHRLKQYWPYPKQSQFHKAGAENRERLLMAGNQLGKTMAAAAEVSMHLTGRYPEWWKGKRFTVATHWLAGSESGELTKKGVQRLLLGRDVKTEWGTGMIPKDCVTRLVPGAGIPDLLSMALIKHTSGGISTVSFKSYDQGRAKWQADTVHGVWFDEEPPEDVYIEGLTRTNTTLGPVILTFTPLLGMSDVVKRFLIEKTPGTHVTQMGILDVDHYDVDTANKIINSYPPHEREARANGVPILGSGRVYPIAEGSLREGAMKIPDHWPRIVGIDFGWDHPTSAVWMAWDRDADCIHVYDCYRVREATALVNASAIKAKGQWIPVAWPGDGLQTEKGSGFQLQQQYGEHGLNMLPERAQFEKTNTNGETPMSRVSVEAGITEILGRMETSRFKVAEHLNDWWEEFRMYHRKDGKIVKQGDDLMDATRYAVMCLRYATTAPRADASRPRESLSWRV